MCEILNQVWVAAAGYRSNLEDFAKCLQVAGDPDP